MTPEDRKTKLDAIASQALSIRQELELLISELTLPVDQKAIKSIMTDMAWAAENCTVVGLHQIGRALEDNMGFGPFRPGNCKSE